MTSTRTPKTALITGGSRGIGLAVARALVREGVRVALVARGAEELETRRAELGNDTIVVAADLSDAKEADRVVAAVGKAFGDMPDIFVNNAGIYIPKPIDVLTSDDFERMMKVNLIAPFALLRAILPAWKAQSRGHLISLGSVADRTIYPDNAGYSASKFGLRAMHQALRLELRGSGVRATLVSPSAVDTPIWETVTVTGENRYPPRDKMLRDEAVADAVVWAALRPANVNIDELRLTAT